MTPAIPTTHVPLDWALYYHARGWSVIPVNPASKKAGMHEWTPFRSQRASTEQVAAWFQSPKRAVGVILGAVSGNLAALDFDSPETYKWFAATHPELAGTLPTEKTARGYHVLFECEPTKSRKPKGRKVELLCDGAYVICTPSPGKQWLHPPNGSIPRIDPFALGLEKFGITPPEAGRRHFTEEPEEPDEREEREEKEMASVSSVSSVSSGSSVNLVLSADEQQLIDGAIVKTLPFHAGQRNRCCLDLARRLKAIPSLANRPARDLRAIVQDWHARALAVIGTKPFEETWADFVYAWKRVKWPHGVTLAAAVQKATDNTETPPEAANYDDPKNQLLLRICWQLQQLHGVEPFYLSLRTAGGLADLSHTEAAKRMEMFMEDGHLAIATAHTNIKATRYRYCRNTVLQGEVL